MMIKIGAELLDEIRRHAESRYSQECCGLLIGRIEDNGRTRIVAETQRVANSWGESETIHRRMQITPLDYMRAERQFAKQGLGVVGNYHSHPNHPAVPSQFDLENLAPWPTMSYIVVSVYAGKAVDVRSWELEADRSRFNEEEILKG
ncbi:MAG TPA: M67 family metallopeptidase, partial [Pyrinomonadaceae bacterium]|nr:M67 family metallopeptidase [Pyrinomonadaceae bacterium]